MAKLAADEIAALDPYKFMAVIGKRVIHPGGRASTDALLARADITESSKVLDVGCGVGTTAIEIAKRSGAHVTAVDIAPLMLERAQSNVIAAGVGDRVGSFLGKYAPECSSTRSTTGCRSTPRPDCARSTPRPDRSR